MVKGLCVIQFRGNCACTFKSASHTITPRIVLYLVLLPLLFTIMYNIFKSAKPYCLKQQLFNNILKVIIWHKLHQVFKLNYYSQFKATLLIKNAYENTYIHFSFRISSKVVGPLFWLHMNKFESPRILCIFFWSRGKPEWKWTGFYEVFLLCEMVTPATC